MVDRFSVLTFAAASEEKHIRVEVERKKVAKRFNKSCAAKKVELHLHPLWKRGGFKKEILIELSIKIHS